VPDTLVLAKDFARALHSKKAENIVILDLRKVSNIADFFLVASVHSPTQAEAIVEDLRKRLKAAGKPILGTEGSKEGGWMLIDAADVIIHLFDPILRDYYDIENLWAEAPKLEWVPE